MKRNYDDPVYKEWRRKVLARDSYRCQMPNCKRTRYLQVHHIRKWSSASTLRFEIDNGITLCSSCHKEVNRSEHLYESLFHEIVRSKNG
jgi:5-methylcytosine-specific restriction endonuclease McrA